jgi:hypothetical protein
MKCPQERNKANQKVADKKAKDMQADAPLL